MKILEREPFLLQLASAHAEAAVNAGRVVLLSGEAGIGKTALATRFVESLDPRFRVLWGACDALLTPRPLGPLHDIARQTRGALGGLLEDRADRERLFTAFLAELGRSSGSVAIVEDVHWADEATLDLLKFTARRMRQLPALLVLTFRDDEVGPSHPLRRLLGDLPREHTLRLRLPRLSEEAVRALAQDSDRSADALYGATGGNPFFVTEALASGGEGVPASIRDAVLARAIRLSCPARQVLDCVAVVPGRAERWLVEAVASPSADAIESCVMAGMLQSSPEHLSFRHDLARQAWEGSLEAGRTRALHGRILEALLARGEGAAGMAQVVHHADRAGDGAAVLRFAPEAAREAATLGAHREAAAHWRAALRYADRLTPEEHAELLEQHGYECYLTEQIEEALTSRGAALRIWNAAGRRCREGDSLRWLSRLHWLSGRKAEAEHHAREAVRILESEDPPGRELAMAYSNLSHLSMLDGRYAATREWGEKAIELGRRIGDTEVLIHALNNVGTAESVLDPEAGCRKLEESLRLALEGEYQEHVARAFCNLSCHAIEAHDYAVLYALLDQGIEYCTRRDLDSWVFYLRSYVARALLEQGEWTRAADEASSILAQPRVSPVTRIPALVVLARVRVRRGDPGAMELLDEARALALPTGELQRIAPVAAARAEAAWLAGDAARAASEAQEAYALSLQRDNPWERGEICYWLWRAGALPSPPEGIAEPFERHIAGEPGRAAAAWEALGCPYEQAMALGDSDEEPDLRAALAIFERLGATPAASVVRQRLRACGVRRIPRGPRPATRGNAFGLTRRQMQILDLLAQGLANGEIAGRLFISPKTVDHHVSAILAKLAVQSRGEAAALAREQGALTK
ncbi:MAG TPA: AAA family ATPase [Longimicrobiaceae bacterium]|nr:AAA family ATPase [Longimicrobiaceae bacterium]